MIARQYWVKDYGTHAKSWLIAMYCAVKLVMNAIHWKTKYLAWNTHLFDARVSIENVNWQHKNFHKYNFCNDYVVTKIMKIFYYENLGAIWYQSPIQLVSALSESTNVQLLNVTRSAKINHVSTQKLTIFFKFVSCCSHANKTQFSTHM